MSKRKTVSKESHGCQESGGFPRSARHVLLRWGQVRTEAGSDLLLPEVLINFVTFLL